MCGEGVWRARGAGASRGRVESLALVVDAFDALDRSHGGAPIRKNSPQSKKVRPREMRAPGRPSISTWLAQRTKRSAHLGDKELRLLPGGEMGAFVELVIMDEIGIRPLRPTARSGVDLVGE